MVEGRNIIRQIGPHQGKRLVFGYDRYLLPELDGYISVLASYGIPLPAIDRHNPHYLSSTEKVCRRMSGRTDHVGVLICSTGMGVSIAANKFRGIYAARCLSVEDAELSRTINNANVLCLAARSGLAANEEIIHAFMRTPYEGRKLDQLEYITELEGELEPVAPPARPALRRVRSA